MKPLEPKDPQGLLSLKATAKHSSHFKERLEKKRHRKKERDLLFIKLPRFLLISERVEKLR